MPVVERAGKAAAWVSKKTEGMTMKQKVMTAVLAVLLLVIIVAASVSALKKCLEIKLSGSFEVGHLCILVAGVGVLGLLVALCRKGKAQLPAKSAAEIAAAEAEWYAQAGHA